MNSVPRISEAEWEVMEVLWHKHPLSALQVVQELAHHPEWKDPTIRTMLGRLVQKKVVAFFAQGKIYYYSPLITREQCVQQASQSFLQRVFEGAAGSLVLHFVKSKSLSEQELAELESILKENRKGKGKTK